MKEIYTSATKITLLTLVFSLVTLTFLGKVDSKIFEYVITAVVAFYFGQKSNPPLE